MWLQKQESNLQLSAEPIGIVGVSMAVITISRQFGAGGRTLGQRLAKQLGYRFLDDRIIQALADKAGVSTDFIKSIERQSTGLPSVDSIGSAMSRFMSSMLSRSYIERITGSKGYVDEEIYFELLQEVMVAFAREDNVILLGRGGQYILQGYDNAFHILLISDLPHRIQFMQQFYKLSDSEAAKAIKQGDARRSNLYKKLHHEDYNHPHLYHLVLNMSRLGLDAATHAVVQVVQKAESRDD